MTWTFFHLNPTEKKVFILRGGVILFLSILMAKGGGALFHEDRPFVTVNKLPLIAHAADNGFPSDHTLLSAACAFLIAPFAIYFSLAAFVAALFVGLARVGCMLHSPLDITASIVFAGIAHIVSLLIFPKNKS